MHNVPVGRRAALGMVAAVPLVAATPAVALASGDKAPDPVRRTRATGELGRIVLTWEGEAYRPLVDHYAIYGSPTPGFAIGPDTLIAKTVYATFRHEKLGGDSQTWHYRVVTVDAAGNRSRPTRSFSGTSTRSVTLTGRPLATVGQFDGKSLELALAPAGTGQYNARFGNGVDFTYGVSDPAVGWPYGRSTRAGSISISGSSPRGSRWTRCRRRRCGWRSG